MFGDLAQAAAAAAAIRLRRRETLYRQCCLDLHAVVNFLPLAVRHKRLLSPGQQAVIWASWSHLFMLAEQWATNRRPSFLAEAGVLPTNGPEDDDKIYVLQLAFFL